MNHGVHPVRLQKTHYSTRTFGATKLIEYVPFSFDAGFGFPDQNADGWPEECTIYAQVELCQDQDKRQYDRTYVRAQTDAISGQSEGPYDIEDSLKAICVYGPAEGAKVRGSYFMLEREPGLDWFDSALAVMHATKSSLSIASPWFDVFENAPAGLFPSVFPMRWQPGVPGHDHKGYGLDVRDGAPVILDKSWQGTWWGDAGKGYWTREAFNALLSIPGAAAFLVNEYDGSVRTIRYGILYRLEILISLYSRLLTRSVGSALNRLGTWNSTAVFSPF